MRVLVVNAGSSSLKLRLLDERRRPERSLELAAGRDGFDTAAMGRALRTWPRPDVVGHRIVHGGTEFTGPVVIDAAVEARLRALTDLAPLHQPKSLAGLDAVRDCLPGVRSVACFDTAFHATLPSAAATYPLPAEWRARYRLRRYGFHGLSHAYCSARAAVLLGRTPSRPRVVTCHLGAGASLAAVLDGRCVDTTMGFTPLDGLVMATRSGSIDPGLVLWLEQHEQLDPGEIAEVLEHRSGLTALAGTGDMRLIEAAAARNDPDAVLALDVYTHRLRSAIAAMTASLGGLDALVFTGGVGEHSAEIRRRAVEPLGFLGLGVSPTANRSAEPDTDVSAADASVRTLVITAREDLRIAEEIHQLLAIDSGDRASSSDPR